MKRMLRIVIDEPTPKKHQMLRCAVGYIALVYRILPQVGDLEGAVYCVDEKICEIIKHDMGQKYPGLQIECEEP